MTEHESIEERYDEFATTASQYGVTPRRVQVGEVTEVIEELVVPPAIGVPLPWEGVTLPAAVQTAPTPADIRAATTGVTPAPLAIAAYGSVVVRADDDGSEPISLFNDRHVVLVQEADIVPDMAAAFEWFGDELRERRDSMVIETGPSATADMGALVQGAHGPKELEVVVVT